MVDRTEEDVGFLTAVCHTRRHRSHALGDARWTELGQHAPTAIWRQLRYVCQISLGAGLHCFDLLWICHTACCTTSFTTNPQHIESQQQVHNESPQQVVWQPASLTTSWKTCRTASPHKSTESCTTISKSYSKSHNLLYNKSRANRSNGVRH